LHAQHYSERNRSFTSSANIYFYNRHHQKNLGILGYLLFALFEVVAKRRGTLEVF